MGRYDIEWIGDKELQSVMERAIQKSPRLVNASIKNHGELMKTKAISYSPKPGGSRYGPNPYSEGPLHQTIEANYGMMHARIQATRYYASYVNFGTRFMRAQPFFSDAFKDIIPLLEKNLREVAEGLFV